MRLSLVCLGLAGVAVSSPLLDHAVRDLPDAPTQSTRLVPRSYTRHEKHERHHLTGWKRAERPRPDQKLPMRIGLKQSNLDRGHDMLMDIASPDSPNYGRHLTVDQVTDLFAPAAESVDAVRHWLTSAGVDARRISQSTNKQWLQFVASVEEAERLLFADYHLYEHLESGLKTVACTDYHLPKNVSEHVDYVTPGIKLGSYGFHELAMKQKRSMEYKKGMKAKRRFQQKQSSPGLEYDAVLVQQKQTALPTNCDALVRPKCVQDQYGLPNITNPQPGNELGCFQALNQHYHQPDLDMFYRNVAPHIPKGTHPELRAINGGTGPTDKVDDAGVEADLDLQVIIPLIHPQKAVLFQTDDDWYGVNQQRGDTDYPGFFNTLFDAIDGSYCTFEAFNQTGNCKTWDCRDPEYPNKNDGGYKGELMCGVYKPTNVIAISYSGVENFYPQPYLKRQCMEVMKLGLQGTTIIESSGDHGVGGSRLDPQAGCLGEDARIFAPRTMSNCPYVLSVGATMLVNDTARPGKYRETGTTSFASGGGFSNVFDAPEWQTKHITSYLSTANLSFTGYNLSTGDDSIFPAPNELFNRAGRGYPDVSAVGDNMLVVYQLGGASVKGTSVAVPIWGSVLTMVNEERLAANKTPVGFVHKVLYEHPEVFTDIKEGANPGCGSGGFKVKEGWDPVTGLGSPQYDKLVKLFLSLP